MKFYADSTSRTNFLYVFKIFMTLCPFMDTSTKMSGYLYISLPIYDYLDDNYVRCVQSNWT